MVSHSNCYSGTYATVMQTKSVNLWVEKPLKLRAFFQLQIANSLRLTVEKFGQPLLLATEKNQSLKEIRPILQ